MVERSRSRRGLGLIGVDSRRPHAGAGGGDDEPTAIVRSLGTELRMDSPERLCEFETDPIDDALGTPCGKPATWSTDIGAGCCYWCDEHKDELEQTHGLEGTDEPLPTFFPLGGR